MTDPGGRVRLRRAEAADAPFLVSVLEHEDVEPYLAAVRAQGVDEIAAELERSLAEPREFGRFVIEVEEDGDWLRAGTVGFEVANRRSRIASVERLALLPEFRGRGIATRASQELRDYLFRELGYHRIQLEIYGFNERAIEQAERAGYMREGTRRKAYWRRGEWVDGILFGLVDEDAEDELSAPAGADADRL